MTGVPLRSGDVAVAADDVTNVNVRFKQFVTAVGIYAAIHRL